MSDKNREHYPAGLTAKHPYFGLPASVVRLLWTTTLPAGTYLSGTTVLTAPGEPGNSVGSGFVVQAGSLPPNGDPDFFLVTAQHNVRPVIRKGDAVSAQIIRGYDPGKALQRRVSIDLPNERWIHSDDSDVSIIPLPIDDLPPDHNVVAIPATELASRKPPIILSEGSELRAFGSWRVSLSGAIPIARTLYLATFERPKAMIEINGARRPVEIFLAEGTVSRGMSGGPVTTPGGGWANSAVIGLIHGFGPLAAEDLVTADTQGQPEVRRSVFEEIQREIGQVNSRIVYIIPVWDIEPLLERAGYPRTTPQQETS